MKDRWYCFFHASISLLSGVSCYAFLREGTYLHRLLLLPPGFSPARVSFPGDFLLRYYFPDYLWCYSLAFTLYLIFPPAPRAPSPFPALTAFLCGALYELLQAGGAVPGTEDAVDVLLYLSAALTVYGILFFRNKRRNS